MIDVAILEAMAAAGASVEMILVAIKAAQAKQDDKLAQRRAKDAERKRRSRHVHNGHAESRGPSDDVCDTVLHIDKKEDTFLDKKQIKKERKKSICANPLSAGWQPTSEGRAYARAKGWNEQQIDSEGERFRDHSLAGGRKHVDVEAAWRKWVTSPYQQTKPRTANGQQGPSLMDTFDRLIARAEGAEVEGDLDLRDITPGRA